MGSIGLLLVCKPDIFYKSEPGDFPFLENNQTIVQNSSFAFNTSSKVRATKLKNLKLLDTSVQL